MNFENSWDDQTRAASYARLEFPNTYYLAYRDLPEILGRHVTGTRAVDFGCGAGRSTRFLKRLGFEAVGVDIAADMLDQARALDPAGDYRLVRDCDYGTLGDGRFDLVQSIFTFDNIPGAEHRTDVAWALAALLAPAGRLVCLDSRPEMYTREWASFTTKDFPDNRTAVSGGVVRCVMKDVADKRPVEDTFWTEDDYRETFRRAGLAVEAVYRPLGRPDEPYEWIAETECAPWVIFVLNIERPTGSLVRGSGFSEARRESHIRTQTRRMKSYGSRTCGLESPSNLTPSKALLGPPGDCSAGQPR